MVDGLRARRLAAVGCKVGGVRHIGRRRVAPRQALKGLGVADDKITEAADAVLSAVADVLGVSE